MAGDDEGGPNTPNTAPRPCKARPREYKDGENFSQYINHFERVATANKWSAENKLVQLETILKGKAQREFEAFIEEEPGITWEEMVTKLKTELVPSVQKSLEDFAQLKMGDRSPREFYAALTQLSKLAHGDIDAGARHVIVRAQLLQSIPKRLRQDAGKQSSLAGMEKEALMTILTRVYDAELREEITDESYGPVIGAVQNVGRQDVNEKMKEIEQENHRLRMDMTEMKIMVTDLCKSINQAGLVQGATGQGNRGSHSTQGRGQFNMSTVTCYKCQQKGHFARTCGNERVCSKCKKPDHLYADCPEKSKNV